MYFIVLVMLSRKGYIMSKDILGRSAKDLEIAEEVNNEPTSLHPGDVGVPFKDWECGYCPYQGTVCPGKSKLGG